MNPVPSPPPGGALARALALLCALCAELAFLPSPLKGAAPRTDAARPAVALDSQHRAFLEAHCQKCHGPKEQKGKFRVDELAFVLDTPETAERWQKVLNSLNSGEMPPEEERQPPGELKAGFLEALSHTLVAARRALSDQGGKPLLRRLNQREYRNTLRDLLGVRINVSQLPSDTSSGAFDTMGANLFMSGNQIDQYRALALEALNEAFGAVQPATAAPRISRYECEEGNKHMELIRERARAPKLAALQWEAAFQKAVAAPENTALLAELRKSAKTDSALRRLWARIPGVPNPDDTGFKYVRGDKVLAIENGLRQAALPLLPAEQYFEQPLVGSGAYLALQAQPEILFQLPPGWPVGKALLRIRAGADPALPGERRFIEFGPSKGSLTHVREITGTFEQPHIFEIPIQVNLSQKDREQRSLFFRERGTCDHQEQLLRRINAGPDSPAHPMGNRFGIWIDWIEIEHLPVTLENLPPGLAALNLPLGDSAPEPSEETLHAGFHAFCLEAFRGATPSEDYLQRLVRLYRAKRASGEKHSGALKHALSAVLASPSFLYLSEPQSAGERRPLEPRELACRLSYFLWGAPPDARLRALAASGELGRPAVLAAETERLLDDARSADWIRPFVHQWWSVERLGFFEPDWKAHPRFDNATRWAAREEMYETFAHLVHTGGSIRDLLKADYVVVNSLMARYYGLLGVEGDAFRPVKLLLPSPRGGVLGMAAFSFMGSNGHHSSPVERGAWVLRKLLNDPPPPAPANVPSLNRLEGRPLTTRERLLAHQEQPQCASCHRKIDPIGLGLENFDPVGQWRTQDSLKVSLPVAGAPPSVRKTEVTTWEVDPAAALHRGPAFQNFFELRELLWERPDAFARGFSSALLEYALGRSSGFSDEPFLDAMVSHARERGYGLREFVRFLVSSPLFQSK